MSAPAREGELLVRAAFPAATILRPSVLFGPDDKFLNTLIAVTRLSPVLALFGDGDTRLQPVYRRRRCRSSPAGADH